jgi:hypothetical protein
MLAHAVDLHGGCALHDFFNAKEAMQIRNE